VFQVKLGMCPVMAHEHALLPELHCPGLPLKELGEERLVRAEGQAEVTLLERVDEALADAADPGPRTRGRRKKEAEEKED
jgi:hypothetical protein